MDGRKFNTPGYRYGFNGKEKDDEINSIEDAYEDYGMRMYDARLGRFISSDPLTQFYPWYTPYSFAGNKPIWAIDQDGLEEFFVTQWTSTSSDGLTVTTTRHIVRNKDRSQRGKKTFQYTTVNDGDILDISSLPPIEQDAFKPFRDLCVTEKVYTTKIKVKKEEEIKEDVIKTKPDPVIPIPPPDNPVVPKPPPPPFELNKPLDISVTFEADDHVFEKGKETVCYNELKKIVLDLISNPGYKANIEVGTKYDSDEKTTAVSSPQALVGSRLKEINDYIDKIVPKGFDRKRITTSPNYGTNKKAAVKYQPMFK